MRIQHHASIVALSLLSIIATCCCSSIGYCRSNGKDPTPAQGVESTLPTNKDKTGEEEGKNLESVPGTSPEAVQPHPGRDAPLWNKGGERQNPLMPMVTKMGEGLLRVGKVMLNKKEGLVTVRGEVNMQEGLVEYLAVATRGKVHESVLKLDVEPYDLQIALLLIGLEPGSKPLKYQGDPAKPEGDPVEIWVTWSDKEKKFVKHRGEELILNKNSNKPMEQTHWIFCGSQIINGRFMAAVEHSVVAVYHDPYAILDNPTESGGSDMVHFVNSAVTPPKGTPVNLVIKSVRQPQRMGPRLPTASTPKKVGSSQ